MAKSDHKRHSAKHKIDRRLGVNLWGRPKSPLNSREYGPGQHGQRRKKPTDFGVQLMAKQKLKGYYGNIGEKQFKKYYQKAVRAKGDTGQNLVGIGRFGDVIEGPQFYSFHRIGDAAIACQHDDLGGGG